jgi:hypothetical protein
MAYVNLPPNLQDMFYSLNDRISKLETVGAGNLAFEKYKLFGAFNGSQNIDLYDSSIYWWANNAVASGALNFRANSSITLEEFIPVGISITCVVIITNGPSPAYPTNLTRDGVAFNKLVWQGIVPGGNAPTSGVPNAEDVYSFTLSHRGVNTWHCRAQRVTYA